MLVNDLSTHELHRLIGTFLKLTNINEMFVILSRFYDQKIKDKDDLYKQYRIKLIYKGFDLRIKDIRSCNSTATSVIAEFKKRENIWDRVFKTTLKEIVKDLKDVSRKTISDLEFSIFSYTPQFENHIIKYHYDSKAFNRNWQNGYEISPLIIAPDIHDGNCFVEFLFNADCYTKTKEGDVKLSPTWNLNISNISKGIQEDARKLLGNNQ